MVVHWFTPRREARIEQARSKVPFPLSDQMMSAKAMRLSRVCAHALPALMIRWRDPSLVVA